MTRFILRPLTLDAQSDIEAVTRGFPPYCDFNFASLYVWDIDDDTRYAVVGDNLVLELRDNTNRAPLYSLIGSSGVADLAEELIARSVTDGYGGTLGVVPEEVASALRNDHRFDVTSDPDNDDYVMSVPRLATALTGSRAAELKRFQRAFPAAVVEHVSLESRSGCERVAALFETWARSAKTTDPLLHDEDRRAFGRALANAGQLGLEAIGIALEGDKLVACEILQILRPSAYAISHFQKIDRRVSGVSAFLNQSVARSLQKRGIELINFEQDLGVPGLRNAKRSYDPVGYLKKFNVTLRAGRDPRAEASSAMELRDGIEQALDLERLRNDYGA